jgi:hypothetical protein
MSNPKANGTVSHLAGKAYVVAGSRKEPGLRGLIRPSMNTDATTVQRVSRRLGGIEMINRTSKATQDAQNTCKAQEPKRQET